MPLVFSVIGMHKSGTTLVAELLNSSGISMVESSDIRSYDEGNHCERISTGQMNKELLACGSTNSLRVLKSYVPGSGHSDFQKQASEIIADALREGGGHWGFKDPRTCLTHEFWIELLPCLQVICIFRSASSVRGHYVARVPKRFKKLKRGISALRAWGVYNTAVIEVFRSMRQHHRIMLSYEVLLERQSEFERLSAFVGLPIKDVRRPELNREVTEIGLGERIERWVVKTVWGFDTFHIERQLEELRLEDANRLVTRCCQTNENSS